MKTFPRHREPLMHHCKDCGDAFVSKKESLVCCGDWKCGWCGCSWKNYDDVEGCCNEGIAPRHYTELDDV